MTTPRTRRTKIQQALDALQALLEKQLAKSHRLYAVWEAAEAEAARTRRAIEGLMGLEVKADVNNGGPQTGEATYSPSTMPTLIPTGIIIRATPDLPLRHGDTGDDLNAPQTSMDVDNAAAELARLREEMTLTDRGLTGLEIKVMAAEAEATGKKAPSACAHPQTGLVRGVRRCFTCNEKVE